MLGSSRESLKVVSEGLSGLTGDPAFGAVGGELLQAASLLGRESTLRASLSDSGTPLTVRTGVVDQIFGSQGVAGDGRGPQVGRRPALVERP